MEAFRRARQRSEAVGLFKTIVRSIVPTRRKRKRRRKASTRAGGGFRPSEGAGTSILISDIYGSGGADIADRLATMIGNEAALGVLRIKRAIRQNNRIGVVERLMVAADEGAALLTEEKANVLVWGEMEELGLIARIRFLADPRIAGEQGAIFGLADALDLPVPMTPACGDLVRAVAVAVTLPIYGGSRGELLNRLGQHLKGAEKVLEDLPADFHDEHRASILKAMGVAHATAYKLGDKKAGAEAAKAFEAAAALISPDAVPVLWALVQTHWGALLETDAKMRKDVALLEAAAARYKTVSDKLGREGNAYDWALAHVRRGQVLYRLSTQAPSNAAEYLKAASGAYGEALTVYDRSLMPKRWAEVMNSLGVVQMALGSYPNGNAMLQEAITTFRKVKEVYRQDTSPLLWAQTSNNLGAACVALAKRTKEDYLLDEAAVNFKGAMEAFRRLPRQKKRAAMIANNLDRVERMISNDAA